MSFNLWIRKFCIDQAKIHGLKKDKWAFMLKAQLHPNFIMKCMLFFENWFTKLFSFVLPVYWNWLLLLKERNTHVTLHVVSFIVVSTPPNNSWILVYLGKFIMDYVSYFSHIMRRKFVNNIFVGNLNKHFLIKIIYKFVNPFNLHSTLLISTLIK